MKLAPSTDVETTDSPARTSSVHDCVIQALQEQKGSVYAILDAARDPLILARLFDCTEEHQSLYEGTKGDELMAFAPYLVALPRGSAFLETIVREGWGKCWGVYLTCEEPFKEVRKHLRHFLMVQMEAGKQVYFRFYDPRVLRVFLPTCNTQETIEFFGPIRQWLVEGDDPAEVQILSVESRRLRAARRYMKAEREVESRGAG
jgi:hypothetical protein